ncbi:hypothetical protein [Sphingobacterium sp.]|uniref:hypothetical protein n=1 Tax=Sphingobacterium sp. TaxID=341027 RepID=UPI0031E10F9D
MERQLPTLKIEGTTFLVDVEQMVLVHLDDPDTKIRFAEMDNEDTHYTLEYDIAHKDIAGIHTKNNDLKLVEIPRMTQLDAEGMALKYNVPLRGISEKMDYEVMVENPEIAMRMQGKLNRIEIEGHPFYVDFRMWSLRPHNDFSTQGISMEPLHENEQYEYFPEDTVFLYQPKKHELFEPDWSSITELPKDTVIIKFPMLKEMDAVGYAHRFNRPLKEVLLETNFKPVTQAIKRQLSQTTLPELFKENKERLAQEKVQINKDVKRKSRKI